MRKILILYCLFCCKLLQAQLFNDNQQTPLHPEQAFQLSAEWLDKNTLQLNYKIAKGYYLYQQAFEFSLAATDIKFSQPELPPATIIDDPYFGEVGIYRDTLSLNLIISGHGNKTLTLIAKSQGCADIGLCYPIYTHTINVTQ